MQLAFASALRPRLVQKALCLAALALAAEVIAQPATSDVLRGIEHRAERNPNRAARELTTWLETTPKLSDRDRLRIELIRAEVADATVECLRSAIAALQFAQFGVREHLTLSASLAAANRDDRDFGALLNRADMGLYRAKREGRNRVNVATLEEASANQEAA